MARGGRSSGIVGWLRHLVRRDFSFGGLCGALVFFWLSLTPSLLPRAAAFQGVVSAITAMIGYGLGTAASALIRRFLRHEPSRAVKQIAWRVLVAAALVGSALMLWQSAHWDEDLRALVGLEPDRRAAVTIVVVTVVFASVILLGARLVRSLGRFLTRQVERVVPRPVALAVGGALAVLVIVGFVQGFLLRRAVDALDAMSAVADESTDMGATRPTSPLRSGSDGSLVEWDSLGRMGRRFVGLGPTVEDLERFHEPGCCEEPVRTYVGLESGDSVSERAALAVEELERTGAFERAVLVVYTATGTGWINPRAADGIEYIHRGDTAQVSIQYSYLPSWISFLVDQRRAADAGEALIGAVLERLDSMATDDRPMLLLYGESLGSFGTEEAFASTDDMQDSVDGALLVGPTFSNDLWRELTEERLPGSPEWLPEVDDPGVRFARDPADLEGFAEADLDARIVYLQNSSDPITWWNTELAYRKPDWADPPDPPDRAPAFRWFPIVTFWQGAMDLADSLGVPTGYGHNFGSNVVDAWLAIERPDGWTDADTAALKQLVYDAEG